MTRLVHATVLRRLVVALLALAVGLSGAGSVAAAPRAAEPATVVIGGLAVAICQSGRDADQDGKAIGHHCCDHCALCAAIALPPPSALVGSIRFDPVSADLRPAGAAVLVQTGWSPRQPTGPPAA